MGTDNENTFINIVAYKYDKIKSLFSSRLYNMDLYFDEDLFNDTIIKCHEKFGTSIIDYDTTIKYFWIAYLNTIKSDINKSNNISIESLDTELHDCIDDIYNEFIDEDYAKDVYNIVMNAITAKYGKDDMIIYSLYKYHNWSEADLKSAGYDCKDLKEKIKTIHRFVKSYCKKIKG
jgi:hypothetical protein